MAGEIEYAKCDICGGEPQPVTRKYYRYPVQCDCCNSKESNHFEIIRHCNKCEPKPPRTVTMSLQPLKE